MSSTYVPPVPPPPPPSQPPKNQVDFSKAFTFFFEDPEWLKKMIIGGLFYLAAFLLVGIPFLLGYMARTMRNSMEGLARPLPEWDDLGGMFMEGLRLLLVGFLYALPVILLYGLAFGGMAIMGSNEHTAKFSGCFAAIFCIVFVVVLAIAVVAPAAITLVVAEDSLAAGFNFSKVFAYIKGNLTNYLLAFLIHLLANLAAQFGAILICIGVVFTAFWSVCVAAWVYGEAYRLSPVK